MASSSDNAEDSTAKSQHAACKQPCISARCSERVKLQAKIDLLERSKQVLLEVYAERTMTDAVDTKTATAKADTTALEASSARLDRYKQPCRNAMDA